MLTQSLRVLVILMAALTAACGGGGGGGADPGGGSTSTTPTPVTLTTLAPAAVNAGTAATVLTATGSGFTASSVIEWNGTALTTSYVTSTSLTATLPAADLATPGTVPVTVSNTSSGGASSGVVNFTISEQTAPTIATLTPAALMAGGTSFQLIVSGTNFQPGATVLWNGSATPTEFDSATQLTAQVTAARIANVGNVPVAVSDDAAAGGTSNVSNFMITVTPPAPTLTSVSPSSIPANNSAVQLTLIGTNFTSTTQVSYNGSVLPANYISPTQLTFAFYGYFPASGTTASICVRDPAAGGASSNFLQLTITPAIPVASGVTPATLTAEQGATTIAVTGQYFTPTSVVYFNGSARPTTLDNNNNAQLDVQLTAQDISTAGSAAITVEDPVSGNVASSPVSLTIQPLPALVLTSLFPATVPAGNGAFTLTVEGNGFSADSVITWNGTALTTTHLSVTTLQAAVSASLVASIGTAPITIVNPANEGGTSAPQTLSIVKPSIDAVSYQMNNGHTGSVTFQSASLPNAASWSVNIGGTSSYAVIVGQRVYVMANNNGNSQLFALNAATGAMVWGPIAFAGPAGVTYDAGSLFINSGSGISAGILSALDATTGNPKWSATIPGTFATQSPAVAAQGLVYILEDGELTAFDEGTGAQVWQQDPSGTNGSVAVTVDGVYVSAPCTVYDFTPAIGSIIWTHNTGCEGGGGSTPVVAAGRAYAPIGGLYSGNVYDSESGTVLGAFNYSTLPAISATHAYTLLNSTLQGVTLSNNQVDWSFAGDALLVTSPIVVNNYVFIGSSSGNLYGLDATTGTLLWTQNLGAAIPGPENGGYGLQGYSGLAAGDGLLIVPAGNTVTAYVLSTNP